MQPTAGNVFVKKAEKQKAKFEVVDNTESRYIVTSVAHDVKMCEVGDYVLIKDYRSYKFEGEDIHVVHEDDIVAVKPMESL